MYVLSYGEKLRSLRKKFALTLADVAKKIRISEAVITHFENNRRVLSDGTKKILLSFIDDLAAGNLLSWIDEVKAEKNDIEAIKLRDADAQKELKERQERQAREMAQLRRNMTHVFSKGQRYSITDTGNGGDNTLNPLTGKGCIFIYLHKDGTHHCFREEHGGWTRTYTDTQLMGKTIKEVKHESKKH